MGKSVKIIISGQVQGVGFRAWIIRQAEARNLSGWVRNLSDGTVEALFSGEEGEVEKILDECRKGPPGALISQVKSEDSEEFGISGFRQKPTL